MVLVVLALLSLGAYTFAEFMIVETQATAAYGREAQARAAADSGIELAAALIAARAHEGQPQEAFFHNPQLFGGVLMADASSAKGRVRFSLIAPLEGDVSGQAVRLGLIDESSRLNLNAISQMKLDEEKELALLMNLPGMTVEVAQAILDFIDTDSVPRQSGAEDEYYSSLSPPYQAKNGPLAALDELLMVRGVTPQLLYGEDANRNGLLDPNENDGDASLPLDNADGQLQVGWSEFLTVFSREMNQQLDGTKRINVNMNALADLYDQLAQQFDEDTAKFVVAYRLNGAKTQATGSSGSGGSAGGSSASRGSGGSSGGTSGVTTITAQNVGQTPNSTQTINARQVAPNEGVQQLVSTFANAMFAGAGQVTRGDMDLTNGGSHKINSLFDLVGVDVQARTVRNTSLPLSSPWSSTPSDMQSYLPKMFDKLTTREGKLIEGRVNINLARREVLLGIPNMTEELANAIAGAEAKGDGGQSLAGQLSQRVTTGWLVIEGLTDLATLRTLDPYITARGDVFRMQSVGFLEGGGPTVRMEAVVDGTQDPPRVIFQRDLTELGRGYSPARLMAP